MASTTDTFGTPVAHEPEGTEATVVHVQPPVQEIRFEGDVRVTMLAHITGTRNGQDWPPAGGEITVPAEEAATLVRMYLAKPAPEPEEAAVAPEPTPERAVAARSRRR